MAAAVQSLRLCTRACRHASAPRRIAPRILISRRAISYTPAWRADADNETSKSAGLDDSTESEVSQTPSQSNRRRRSNKVVSGLQEGLSHKDKEMFEEILSNSENDAQGFDKGRLELTRRAIDAIDDRFTQAAEITKEETLAFDELEESMKAFDEVTSKINRPVRIHKRSFWGEDEEDPDLVSEDMDEDDFGEDDIMSMAHGKLEEHREYREYARIAAWQMPLLSKLARPFEPPTAEECLRFRYTTYMGESHPAQSKVVLEFCPQDLLPAKGEEAQRNKLLKLLGPRWNPETNIAKMSCEQFDHQAQNKRYLGDLVQKLLAEAKDTTDTFEDIPLDTRHHQMKSKPRFPREWRLTEKRIQEIEDSRQKSLLLDQAKEEEGSLVDGAEKIDKHFSKPELASLPTPEYVRRGPNLSPSRPAPRQRRF
ncbi:mitochondrial ribosomal subunit protein-domain-containing protein [Xylariales sp. AK1849]|nr:mitochondrial ribosomal subunit protein-domain-containing protein [Xylariales sp. AK1849]